MDAAPYRVYCRPMITFLNGLLYLVMAALVGVLGFGIYNLYKSDDGARSRSNKLMRLRIVVQAVAILLIAGIAYLRSRTG